MSDFNYEGLRRAIYEATGEDWDTAGQIAKLGGDAFLADNELYVPSGRFKSQLKREVIMGAWVRAVSDE